MIVKQCSGYELEKEKKNTSEDFFNRSEVTYIEDGEERTFHVLYVRYFDELLNEFTPFQEDPIFQAANRDVTLKEIVAIACLLKKPEWKQRKRAYINSKNDFAAIFQGLDFEKLKQLMTGIEEGKQVDIQSSEEFIAG